LTSESGWPADWTHCLILFEDINDIEFPQLAANPSLVSIGHCFQRANHVSVAQIIAGDEQLISTLHAHGIKVFGATLTPFGGSAGYSPAGEAERQKLNTWIRTSGAFDGVFDFARAVGDPGNPNNLNPPDDSGDGLHPNDAGYAAMASAINLGRLTS
jgi:lysophospholipase L1-like esterase